MKAVVRLSSKAPVSEASPEHHASPEHNASATSGTYFRAVRLTDEQATAALADEEKLLRLGSLLDSGMWRVDSELVASRMIDLAARKVDPR